MSETKDSTGEVKGTGEVKLQGLFALKLGMSVAYDDNGDAVPVTLLKFDKWVVSQLKTKERDGYTAVQLASKQRKVKNSKKTEVGHFKSAGLNSGAQFVAEIRQELPEGVKVGQLVGIESLVKGDLVKVVAKTKGRGFSGSVKRFNFAGGPAAHGSKFHRQPGSSGNRTWPGRIMPGKRFPGHYGNERVTVRNLKVVDVLPTEGVIILKGSVPGAPNGLVKLVKE